MFVISVKILGAIVSALINIWQIRHSITSVTCTIQYYSNQAKYLLAYKYIIRRDLRLKIKLFTRRDLRQNTNFIQDVVCVYITKLNTNFIQGVICVKTTYQAKYLLAYKYIIRRDLRLKINLFTRRDLRLNTNFIQDVVCVYITKLNTNFIQGVICVKTTYQAKYLLAYKYIIRRDLRLKIKLFTRRDLRLNTNFIQGVVCVYTTNFIVYTRCGLHLLTLTTTLFIHIFRKTQDNGKILSTIRHG